MNARKTRRPRLRRDLPLIVVGLVAALLIGECALRIYFAVAPDPPGSRYIRDRDTGYRLRPGPFWEDARDPPTASTPLAFATASRRCPGRKVARRIVGIGDSFVLGAVPIEENFLRIAGHELDADVALMGLGGFGPAEYLGALRSAGLSIDPDRMVLCFYIGNDVTGIPLRGAVRGGELYFTGSLSRWTDRLRKSQLFALAERVFVTRIRVANLKRDHDRGPRRRTSAYYRLVEKNRLPVYGRNPAPRVRSSGRAPRVPRMRSTGHAVRRRFRGRSS